MSTIGNQLNILRDTQMVQRRLLEKQFPYIDWKKMPFSSYGDFFRLRGIIDDCGAVWTNAYGRSNTEADGQRKFLQDYSGNDRDIELFNFGWRRQSGYNGYVYGMNSFIIPEDVTGTKTESFISVTNTLLSGGTHSASFYNVPAELKTKSWKVFVEKEDDVDVKIAWFSADYSEFKHIPLNNGLNTIPGLTEEESTVYLSMAIDLQHGKSVKITEIPEYRGAIVSDGVDDYGQCTKDFALPDDYTVVAMREILKNISETCVISKSSEISKGAFQFENISNNNLKSFSYGGQNILQNFAKLFSYQTKSQYNDTSISHNSAVDTVEDKLCLLKIRGHSNNSAQVALYSFGIFTRTLTEDELRIVENCMYAEWIAMTGKLEDIEYYDILDARFRSNDEAADKRDRWVGRLGRLHMTLNNYAYSQMSGWNGWPFLPFSDFGYEDLSDTTENKAKITKLSSSGWLCYMGIGASKTNEWRLRIHNPFGKKLYLIYVNDDSLVKHVTLNEGINVIPPATEEFTTVAFNMNAFSIGEYIEVEQLPLYGGALVSDGVDDYAVSDEVIDEEIKSAVFHAYGMNTGYAYFVERNGHPDNENYRLALLYRKDSNTFIHSGIPLPNNNMPHSISFPWDIIGNKMYIGTAGGVEFGHTALYQLRLIKTQPTDVQLEAIKWQCRKEHEDYLIHMGWKDDSPAWYGVEWDVTDPSPAVKRIGNMQMHRDLPVQSQMRGCLLDDNGVVLKYLNADDWTSETLDGSAGQVMVPAPVDSYWRFEKDGNIRRVKFSTIALPGFKRTPQGFISAYEATVQRSTNKLCSVVNIDPDYRGGNNNEEWDGTYRSLLGMPATAIIRTSFRTYARNRKPGSTEWNCMTYDFQKLLYWLFVVEYATLNSQKAFNAQKDSNGYAQGGLGDGVTTVDWTKWSNFNGNNPFVPCGYTDTLGNGTGVVEFSMPTEYDATIKKLNVPRYRGIENPFGHIWQWTDGINMQIEAGDGLSKVFVSDNPEKFNDSNYDGYSHVGNEARTEGYVKSVIFGEGGEIMPDVVGGGSTTYFCDYHYTNIPSATTLRGVLFSGHAADGANAGFAYADSHFAPSDAGASVGSRLCFITKDETEA